MLHLVNEKFIPFEKKYIKILIQYIANLYIERNYYDEQAQ